MRGLGALLANPEPLLRPLAVSAPEPRALRRANRELMAEARESPAVVDVGTLQSLVALAVDEGRLDSLSRRDLREICRAYLLPPQAPGADRRIGPLILNEVERLQRRAAFLALIEAYLERFQVDNADVAALGTELDRMCATWPWRSTDEWRQRARLYALFDADAAPYRLASAILSSAEPPQKILASVGLQSEGQMKGGLAEAAFVVGCGSVLKPPAAQLLQSQLRLIEWGRLGGSSYAYPRAWTAFAKALFNPWSQTEPQGDHKAAIVEAAVSYGGDPRIQPARWSAVRDGAPDAYEVIVRWLTKASVEQFFDIVAESTDRPDMWAQRRKFWESYLRADLISAAWVAFGADGAWRAEQAAVRNPGAGLSMFGRLASGGGKTAEHAALIMNIGVLTIVEWSHNGRWNIWTHGDQGHPKLFLRNTRRLPDYQPRELMSAPFKGSHVGDWQWTVRELIRRETGLKP